MQLNHRQLAYALLRLTIGVNIFGHGLFRILSGVGNFVAHTAQDMEKSPIPHTLICAFSYCTPYIELTLGALLILGLFTRLTLAGSALFIVALTFGTTSIQNWSVAGSQLLYALVFFILLWFAEENIYSLDTILRKK